MQLLSGTEVIADWQGERQAVNGPALYLNSVADAVEQVQEILEPTAAGNTAAGRSGYSYANPSNAFVDGPWEDRSVERDALAAALTAPGAPFEHEAAVPEMTWKTDPSDGHVTGTLELRDGRSLDQVEVTLRPLTGGDEATTLSDGSGWFGFAHVESGHYLVQLDLPNGVVGQPVAHVRVKDGKISEAEFRVLIKLG